MNAWYGWADGSRESATYVRGANRAKIAERLADRMAIPAPSDQVRGAGLKDEELQELVKSLAPRVGLEPTTKRLTVACSTN